MLNHPRMQWTGQQSSCSDNKNKFRQIKEFVLSFCHMNFSMLQKMPLGKKRSSYPLLTADFPSRWDTEPALSSCCLTMIVMAHHFHSFPGATLILGTNYHMNFVLWLWSSECKLLSKLLQEMPKSLVHSNDEKTTSPCPRGNIASYMLQGEITATNHGKLKPFFSWGNMSNQMGLGFFWHPPYSKCTLFAEPLKVHLLLDG